MLRYSVSLYERLEAETGLATGWKMTGCLRLATNAERMTEFKRLATTARSFGFAAEQGQDGQHRTALNNDVEQIGLPRQPPFRNQQMAGR